MNFEKVVFGFFIILAMTLNFGFFIGEYNDPLHHPVHELFAAIVVNLVATVLKFGDRTQIGAIHLAASLVADLQLVIAAVVWALVTDMGNHSAPGTGLASVISLSGGAFMANVTSVIILIIETVMMRR